MDKPKRSRRGFNGYKHGVDSYCGKCLACRELDAYLKEKSTRMWWPKSYFHPEPRSTPPSSWSAMEDWLNKYGLPDQFGVFSTDYNGNRRERVVDPNWRKRPDVKPYVTRKERDGWQST